VEIKATFNESFIAELKSTIPWTERRWDPETKSWWIVPGRLAELAVMARGNFEDARLIEGNKWTDLNSGRVVEQRGLFPEEE
jgi:hypothetical protein